MPERQPFLLLYALTGDPEMASVFSAERSIEGWLSVEAALALAQAEAGVISPADAEAIAAACTPASIDQPTLWREAANVGYPILPLVRMISRALPEGPGGRVHYGATTQDIMDSGLALQLGSASERLDSLLRALGDALASLVAEHAGTVMAGRTHAQQAVPTTFGAKLATFLAELTRHRERLRQAQPRIRLVSLHGAAGTSAALGPRAADVRRRVATRLGLAAPAVPWHVARDGVAEFGLLCVLVTGTLARLAREVIDLSRTEIGEVSEPAGHHRGASSTMPQKVNPISSEAIVGMAATAGSLAPALQRAMEGGHERAAGEWQVEWLVLPQVACLAAGCLALGVDLVAGLRVWPEAMRANLGADSGLLMSEAHMIRLAERMGQKAAHDLVYEAAQAARATGSTLAEALRPRLAERLGAAAAAELAIEPEDYLGETAEVCRAARAAWAEERARGLRD